MSTLRAARGPALARLRFELGRPEQRWRAAALLLVSLVLVAAKHGYRDASAAELGFLLAPTAELVSLTSGAEFVYEAGTGWVSRDLMFIIAPGCAGVNFALAAFLALSIGWLGAIRRGRDLARCLLAAALAAYAATLVVNTVRIAIAIALHRGSFPSGDLTPDEVHRIEGVLVYAGGLCALYRLRDRPARLRWMAVPLSAYVAVAVILPILNGAARRDDFARHVAWVAGGCAAVVAVALLIRAAAGLAAGARARMIRMFREPRVPSAGPHGGTA